MPTLQDRQNILRAKTDLARRIKTEHINADLSDMIRNYEEAVRNIIPPNVEAQDFTDPIQLKDFHGDLAGVNLNNVEAPETTFEVERHISPQNLISAANLYSCYQYDNLGIFEVVRSIFNDFFHGDLRITNEPGAISLYRYEKRKKDRFSKKKRIEIYKRVFNYGPGVLPKAIKPNKDFHKLLLNFVQSVTSFYRDQKISEVIRRDAATSQNSFGSLETVKKAGIDLRNSVNHYSSGITPIFTMELASYLHECLDILRQPEIHQAYNVENEWQLIEKIGEKKFNRNEQATIRGTLAQEGRRMLEWLAGDDVLLDDNVTFEITLSTVGKWAERWAISYKSLGRP